MGVPGSQMPARRRPMPPAARAVEAGRWSLTAGRACSVDSRAASRALGAVGALGEVVAVEPVPRCLSGDEASESDLSVAWLIGADEGEPAVKPARSSCVFSWPRLR